MLRIQKGRLGDLFHCGVQLSTQERGLARSGIEPQFINILSNDRIEACTQAQRIEHTTKKGFEHATIVACPFCPRIPAPTCDLVGM